MKKIAITLATTALVAVPALAFAASDTPVRHHRKPVIHHNYNDQSSGRGNEHSDRGDHEGNVRDGGGGGGTTGSGAKGGGGGGGSAAASGGGDKGGGGGGDKGGGGGGGGSK